ncbi:mobilization protein [Kineosporia sp. NBRC 101677]|nr:mobilization protein [Kineosporia sp. NBRC 101677]
MIGKVTRGANTAGLLRYLYGPGKTNEHKDAHLVASWLGDDRPVLDRLEPTGGRRPLALLAARLDLPLQLLPDQPAKHVWQCSMRLAENDRQLTDEEWAQVAREVVEQTGFAPAGDPGGCRWVAVRHAEDHIHIVVTLARQDGDQVRVFRDWPKVHAAARAVEQRFGLVTVESPDRSATVAPSRGEQEKARRLRSRETPRSWLAREVRVVAAGTLSREEFARELARREGVVVKWRGSTRTPGEVTGYSVGRVGDVDRSGKQVWFSGSKLAPDLSLPKLEARWREGMTPGFGQRARLAQDQRGRVFAEANARLRLAGRGQLGAGAAVAASEAASVLADLIERGRPGALTRAADQLARAVRRPCGERPAVAGVHDLRNVSSSLYLLGDLTAGEMKDAVVLVAHVVRLAERLARQPGAQVGRGSAARAAAECLRSQPRLLDAVAVEQIRRALPAQWVDVVLRDPAVSALVAQLQQAAQAGRDPVDVLRVAFESREVGSADSVAAVLHHRVVRQQRLDGDGRRGGSPRSVPRSQPRRGP